MYAKITPMLLVLLICHQSHLTGRQAPSSWSFLASRRFFSGATQLPFSLLLALQKLCTYDHIMRLKREEGYYWGTEKALEKDFSLHWCITIIFEK